MFACRMCRLHLWLSLRRPQMQTAHTRTRTRTQHTESANSSAAPTQTQLSSAQLRMRLARQARRLLGAKRRMRRRVEFNLRTPIGRPTRLLCNDQFGSGVACCVSTCARVCAETSARRSDQSHWQHFCNERTETKSCASAASARAASEPCD